ILVQESPIVEPLSIDEAFLDLTGVATGLDDGGVIGRRLKERIRSEQRLTASVGVAPNKFLAKLASDLEKPDGLVTFRPEEVESRLWALPVERLWGVGPKSAERLHRAGLKTIGDVARMPEKTLASVAGQGLAAHIAPLARGEDGRTVVADHEAKSISE